MTKIAQRYEIVQCQRNFQHLDWNHVSPFTDAQGRSRYIVEKVKSIDMG